MTWSGQGEGRTRRTHRARGRSVCEVRDGDVTRATTTSDIFMQVNLLFVIVNHKKQVNIELPSNMLMTNLTELYYGFRTVLKLYFLAGTLKI